MIAGVISDTHGYFDERVLPFFHGIDVILHAGDIGSMAVLERLGEIAPVFAVEGNNDVGLDLGVEERLVIGLEGHRVQLVHQLPDAEQGSEVIVHGHSHKLLNEWRGETLYLNPGAAGRRGFHAVQSIALLRLEEGKRPEAELIVLGPRLASAARPPRSSH
jgi:putative phosphoesterase